MALAMEPDPVLKVEDLKVYFHQDQGTVKAVDGVSFTVDRGQVLGVIGESGCGKSVTVQTVMRLLPSPPAQIVGGRILYFPESGAPPIDLAALHPRGKKMRSIRGREIGMIFQEPMTAFSPVHTIGNQLLEAIQVHELDLPKKDAEARILHLLKRVDLPQAERVMQSYPHQLSGGMRQRAMIAMALACSPRLLIADEPTTALDVTIQAQILELLVELQEEMGMAIIFITHDLAVVSEMADEIAVMYLGKVLEYGTKEQIFTDPLHPYTRALMRSVPRLDGELTRLEPIRGSVPSPYELPRGCPFHPRCEQAMAGVCDGEMPSPIDVGERHLVSCYLYDPSAKVATHDQG